MAKRNFYEQIYDFAGQQVYSTTVGDNAPFLFKKTAAAGTPTCALVTPSNCGELAIDCEATSEVQNLCLYQNDILQFDIDGITEVEFRVKMNQASLATATTFAF